MRTVKKLPQSVNRALKAIVVKCVSLALLFSINSLIGFCPHCELKILNHERRVTIICLPAGSYKGYLHNQKTDTNYLVLERNL